MSMVSLHRQRLEHVQQSILTVSLHHWHA